MGGLDTPTGRGFAAGGGTGPDHELPEGEVDLNVYVLAKVQVTVATPYDDAEVAAIAEHELGWNATFVDVYRIEVDSDTRTPIAELDSGGSLHRLFGRLRRV